MGCSASTPATGNAPTNPNDVALVEERAAIIRELQQKHEEEIAALQAEMAAKDGEIEKLRGANDEGRDATRAQTHLLLS